MSNYISAFKKKDPSSSANSSENGEDTQAERPSFILGNREELKKIKIKFYALLLLSNFLIISLYQLNPEVDETHTQIISPINHENHTKIKLALKVYLQVQTAVSEIPISLYSENGKLLIKKAFLHPPLEQSEGSELSFDESEAKEYEVEVPDRELSKIISLNSPILKAYPYQEKAIIEKTQRRSAHEIRI